MNTNQKKYTAFMESVCKEFNCPEMLPALNAGFKALCEASDNPFYSGLKFAGEAFNQAFIELQAKYPYRLHNDSSDWHESVFSDRITGKSIWLSLGKKSNADGYFDPACQIIIDSKSGRKKYPLTVDQSKSIDAMRQEIVGICSKELGAPNAHVEGGEYGVTGYTTLRDGDDSWDDAIIRQSDKALVRAPLLQRYLYSHGFTGDSFGKWTQDEFDQCYDEAHHDKTFGNHYLWKDIIP